MKIKYFLPLLLLFYLIGCQSKDNSSVRPLQHPTAKTVVKFDGLPVYSISKNIDAITFELGNPGEEHLFYNKIFDEVDQHDSILSKASGNPLKPYNATYVDTLGALKIYRNLILEEKIKAKLKASYYVYGTKGYTRVTVGDVYFTIDECFSNIIGVKINNYDREKYGHPLFCTEKPLGLVYGKDYKKIERKINKFIEEQPVDYPNKPNSTIIFANSNSDYYTYEDNFIWGVTASKSDIDFPSRTIFHIDDKGKITSIWGKCLDLFGIPCD